MFDASKRPTIKPTTRTYEGMPCGAVPSHGRTRYTSNGVCVVCARIKRFDSYQDERQLRQSARWTQVKTASFNAAMDKGLELLAAAATQLRAAKEHAPRGAWSKNVRAHGLQPKALAAIRRWLEEKEQLERTAATSAAAKEPGKSWMD